MQIFEQQLTKGLIPLNEPCFDSCAPLIISVELLQLYGKVGRMRRSIDLSGSVKMVPALICLKQKFGVMGFQRALLTSECFLCCHQVRRIVPCYLCLFLQCCLRIVCLK